MDELQSFENLIKKYKTSHGIADNHLIETTDQGFLNWLSRRNELRKYYAEIFGAKILGNQGEYEILDKIEVANEDEIKSDLKKMGHSNLKLLTFEDLIPKLHGFGLVGVGTLYTQLPAADSAAILKAFAGVPMTYGTQVAIGSYGDKEDKSREKERKVLNKFAKSLGNAGGYDRFKDETSDAYCDIVVSKPKQLGLQRRLIKQTTGMEFSEYVSRKIK